MEDYKVIGEKLKEARTRKKVSQKEMAEYLNVSRKHISEIENGTSKRVSVTLLLGYCKKLGLTPNEILGISDKSSEEVVTGLNRYLRQLTEEQRSIFEDFLRSFNK